MERIAILGQETTSNLALVARLRALGADAALVPPRVARRYVGHGDTAIGRLDVLPTVDGVEPGLLELLWLERAGIRVVNTARALLTVHDKLRTVKALAAAGIPQPATAHVTTVDELRAHEPPLVVKPRFGSWGRDVTRCVDRAELDRCAARLHDRPWFRRHGALVQELLRSPGHDLRILVAGGVVVGAVTRIAAPGEWRTNVALGGTRASTRPPLEARRLALEAARATGAEFVGVDLVPVGPTSWTVLELNGAADFDSTYSLEGRDVYEDLARALDLPVVAARGDRLVIESESARARC